jgi:hypothetical protein
MAGGVARRLLECLLLLLEAVDALLQRAVGLWRSPRAGTVSAGPARAGGGSCTPRTLRPRAHAGGAAVRGTRPPPPRVIGLVLAESSAADVSMRTVARIASWWVQGGRVRRAACMPPAAPVVISSGARQRRVPLSRRHMLRVLAACPLARTSRCLAYDAVQQLLLYDPSGHLKASQQLLQDSLAELAEQEGGSGAAGVTLQVLVWMAMRHGRVCACVDVCTRQRARHHCCTPGQLTDVVPTRRCCARCCSVAGRSWAAAPAPLAKTMQTAQAACDGLRARTSSCTSTRRRTRAAAARAAPAPAGLACSLTGHGQRG